MKFSLNSLMTLFVATTASCSFSSIEAAKILPNEINASSKIGQTLLSKARKLNDNNNGNGDDYTFVSGYSIKFQGCHHVSQWNNQYDNEDDVHIMTKRLVRFRLCPSNTCTNKNSNGCSSKYGDYIVDLNTYVSAYMDGLDDNINQLCYDIKKECNDVCGSDDGSDEECLSKCYKDYELYNQCWAVNGYNFADDDNAEEYDFDAANYAECVEFDGNGGRRKLNDGNDDDEEYYIGPYCANQGGSIYFGVFSDDTCTTFSQSQDIFYNTMGYELPYAEKNLVTEMCLSCSDNNNNNGNGNDEEDGEDNNNNGNNNNNGEVNEMCDTIYSVSGKCETKMNIDYPNESACTYIEGIKIIRADGVIRTQETKKSKAAAIFIGLFMTVAVLLLGYVWYLRTKLGRAKINLSAAAGVSGLS